MKNYCALGRVLFLLVFNTYFLSSYSVTGIGVTTEDMIVTTACRVPARRELTLQRRRETMRIKIKRRCNSIYC